MVNAWTWGLIAGAAALADLRDLVRGIYPPILAELDLVPSDDDNRRVLAVLAYLNT